MKLVEPFAVIDIFVTGVAAVEMLKGNLIRFIHYVEQTNEDGELEHIVVAKIVMPMESVAEARQLSATTITAYQAKEAPRAH